MADPAPLLEGPPPDPWAATLKEVLALAAPNALRSVLMWGNEVTNMVILAQTTSDPAILAAIGLGNMMQNVFAMSVGLGLISAFDTLVSQAYGAGDDKLCVETLQRGRLIALLQLIWIAPLMYFSTELLLAVGQDGAVAEYAGHYNKAALLGLPGLFMQEAFKSFLVNRSEALAPMVVSIVTSALHVVWCGYFVVWCGLGNLGAGLANVVTWNLGYFLLLAYVLAVAPRQGFDRWAMVGISPTAWHGWAGFLSIGIPATLQLCGEWWFWEICALVVGYLGEVPLAAHVGTLTYVTVVFMPTIGISQSAASLVGQATGSGSRQLARRASAICLVLNWLVIGVLSIVTLLLQEHVGALFSPSGDATTQALLIGLIHIYFPVVAVLDSTQNIMGGIMRGLGLVRAASYIYLVSFYAPMLPFGIVLAFPLGLGVRGIWYSMAAGPILANIAFFILIRFQLRCAVCCYCPGALKRQHSIGRTSGSAPLATHSR